MLKRLEMHNFKSVRHDVMTFDPGLVAVRGVSEAGKSTRIHAIRYALYGARALNLPLADIVTWGEKETTLKVVAVLEVGDRVYEFRRAKSGAEVYVDGNPEPYVTGQTEVTNFAASLVGADMVTADKLMFANQGSLRGALEHGPKATAEMIEDLADFTLFETLLERMEKNLVLGSDSQVRERLERAQAALSEFDVKEPDHTEKLGEIEAKQAIIKSHESLLKNTLEPALRAAQDKVATAKADRSAYDKVLGDLERASTWVQEVGDKLSQAQVQASQVVDHAEIDALKAQLKDADAAQEALEAWKEWKALPKSEAEWEGDFDSLVDAIEQARDDLEVEREDVSNLQKEIAVLKASIVETSDTCPTCGQEIKDHAEILARNEKARKRISQLSSDLITRAAKVQGLSQDVKDMEALVSLNRAYEAFASKFQGYATVDEGFVPHRIVWKGEKPEALDTSAITTKVEALETKRRSAEEAGARVVALEEELARAHVELKRLESVDLGQPPNIEALREAQAVADGKVTKARQDIQDLERAISEIKVAMQVADQTYQTSLQKKGDLETQVAQAKEDLETLAFNNNLLKKIRAARPIVADKLWSMVLGAVSTMFSKMRGTRSVVTKGKDGFLVNGEAVGGLSGSTLDILGLAIRVALLRTFVPNCSFLTLDEPFSACSEDRAANMLAFIQACGFPQTLLITHEDISESVSDQLIVLGD